MTCTVRLLVNCLVVSVISSKIYHEQYASCSSDRHERPVREEDITSRNHARRRRNRMDSRNHIVADPTEFPGTRGALWTTVFPTSVS